MTTPQLDSRSSEGSPEACDQRQRSHGSTRGRSRGGVTLSATLERALIREELAQSRRKKWRDDNPASSRTPTTSTYDRTRTRHRFSDDHLRTFLSGRSSPV